MDIKVQGTNTMGILWKKGERTGRDVKENREKG
jgi:hypothetical protein